MSVGREQMSPNHWRPHPTPPLLPEGRERRPAAALLQAAGSPSLFNVKLRLWRGYNQVTGNGKRKKTYGTHPGVQSCCTEHTRVASLFLVMCMTQCPLKVPLRPQPFLPPPSRLLLS